MSYTIRIPQKYFYRLKEICKDYNSYRECIMKELEKKYNFKIYNAEKSHDTRIYEHVTPKPIYIIIFKEENKNLEELANKLGKSKYELIMSLFK
jgi:hypothetical protein